jgi:NMD protein affecting ribosome stability and mRNA decay
MDAPVDSFGIVAEEDTAPMPQRTLGTVLCCLCGVAIAPNAANMCVNCLRTQVDLTDGIGKQVILHQCRGCLRYLRPPWVACELESKELLAICLKKIPGLGKVKLVDAGFIWTEPHSKRIRMKLTVQKDVLNGVKLQQVFAVEFLVQNQQCDACQRSYTEHTWRASVQVRQRVEHKRTFYLLEQLILKHGMHEKCINVEQVPAGIDFFFSERSHALKFLDFLAAMVPIKHRQAKQLISEDVHTATKNYKFAYAVEIVPLCKDDLCVLPARLAAAAGNINPLCLVFRVGTLVSLLDPRSLQLAEVNGEKFWADPFRPIVTGKSLEEFLVLDVTPVTIAPLQAAALRRRAGGGGGGGGRRARAAAAQSARERAAERTGGEVVGGGGGGGGLAGSKRRESGDDDAASTFGASSAAGGKSGGGFTGAVSLLGGSVQFNGAVSSVASTVTGGPRGRLLLADAEVIRVRDLGASEARFTVRTHMGNLLKAGDRVLGYDLTRAVFNDTDADSAAVGGKHAKKGATGRAAKFDLPDVVLVRKAPPRSREAEAREMDAELAEAERTSARAAGVAAGTVGSAMDAELLGGGGGAPTGEALAAAAAAAAARRAAKARIWRLKRLDDVVPTVHADMTHRGDAERAAAQYEAFLQEIEADPDLRRAINLYKDPAAIAARSARMVGRAGGGGGARGAGAPLPTRAAPAPAACGSGSTSGSTCGGGGGGGVGAQQGGAARAAEEEEGEEEEEGGEEEEGTIALADLLDDMDLGGGGRRGGPPGWGAGPAAAASGNASKASGSGGAAALAAAAPSGWGGACEKAEEWCAGTGGLLGGKLDAVAEEDDDDL